MKKRKSNGIPCSNMREFDAAMCMSDAEVLKAHVQAVDGSKELLESLKKLERWFSDEKIASRITSLDQMALDEIRRAIAKAEGK